MGKMILLSMAVMAMFGGAASRQSQSDLAGAPGHVITLTDCTQQYRAQHNLMTLTDGTKPNMDQQELGDPSTDHDRLNRRFQFMVVIEPDPEPDTWSMRDNKELRNDINDVSD
jgi:hypothetical protein